MTDEPLVLAIDQGSTGTKVICVDISGKIVASSYTGVKSFSPADGWVEHDPIQIWESVLQCLAKITPKITARVIGAIGITNQRETTVVWDRKTGTPVYNAISWQCRRSAEICQKYRGLEEEIKARTGSPLDAYYSATKLLWLFENVPEIKKRSFNGELLFGTIDSWIIWNLTNRRSHATDTSNASRTLLFNIEENDWDNYLLSQFEIPQQLLPNINKSNGFFGEAVVPGEFFINPVPILGCLGDQQSALFGQTCFYENDAKCTFGTCLNLGINTGDSIRKSSRGLTPTIAWNLDDSLTYKVEGGVYVAGSLLDWLVNKIKIAGNITELTEMAKGVNTTENLAFVPAFVGLAAPYWDMTARGVLIGLSFNHERAHIAKAALESIALQTYDVLRTAREDLHIDVKELNIDGGMAKNDYLMQLIADLGACSLTRPEYLESTSLGVAYMAGLSANFWKCFSEVKNLRKIEKVFEPNISDKDRDNLIDIWNRAIERSRGWNR